MTQTPLARPKRRWKLYLGVAFLVLMLLACFGVGSAVLSGADSAPSNKTESATPQAQTPATNKPKAVTKLQPKTQMGNGTFKVGTDIAAGEYLSEGAKSGVIQLCYWAVSQDANMETIDAYGSVTGLNDPVRAKVAKGQYFKSQGCEPWMMQ